MTLPKTQRQTHTLLSRQASLSLVMVESQVTFRPSRVQFSLFVSLLSTFHALQGSSLLVLPYTLSVRYRNNLRMPVLLRRHSGCLLLSSCHLPVIPPRLRTVLYITIFACLQHLFYFYAYILQSKALHAHYLLSGIPTSKYITRLTIYALYCKYNRLHHIPPRLYLFIFIFICSEAPACHSQ